jgi:hypothetical protein
MQRLEFIDLAIVSPAPIVALARKSRKQRAAELAKNTYTYVIMYSRREGSTSSLTHSHTFWRRSIRWVSVYVQLQLAVWPKRMDFRYATSGVH